MSPLKHGVQSKPIFKVRRELMHNSAGAVRLACVFTVSVLLMCCGFYGEFIENSALEPTAENSSSEVTAASVDEGSLESTESSGAEKTESTPEAQSSSTAETALPTATEGTVKGKIISNYISPYNAPLSYGGVYLKNSAGVSVDIKELLTSPLSFKTETGAAPQVLIMHTHTTETYMTEVTDYYTDAFSSRSRNTAVNMVSVGEIVAEKLNTAGINTLHDKTEHDYPKYTGSYSRAAETIKGYLKKYPSIKVVLDLHRDAAASGDDKIKLSTEIGGKRAAQVMLVMGSQSGNSGSFPNWRENLKLAVRLQQALEKSYPTLARPISLTGGTYNQNLTTGSLLIEFGTDANTVAEAHYSAELVGTALADVLLSGN